jgi:hypothetical protein
VKVTLPRYRWWLLIAGLALLVAGLLCWPRTSVRFTREQYDRIRFGMTPAEVASSIGSDPSPIGRLIRGIERRGTWHTVASDVSGPPLLATDKADVDVWVDKSVIIEVQYRNGKAFVKMMDILVPSWKAKARNWLNWLRGLVGL